MVSQRYSDVRASRLMLIPKSGHRRRLREMAGDSAVIPVVLNICISRKFYCFRIWCCEQHVNAARVSDRY